MSSMNGNQPVVMQPSRGSESVWEFAPSAVQPMPNFGNRPTSTPYRDPDRWGPLRDVLVAGLVLATLLCVAGAYVGGAFSHQHKRPAPGRVDDPFAVVGNGAPR